MEKEEDKIRKIAAPEKSRDAVSRMESSGNISAQLVPEFSRKLSIVEDENQDIVTERITGKDTDNKGNLAEADTETVHDVPEDTEAARTATDRASFACSCGKQFEKSVQLAAHKRWSCALREKKVQCDVCKNWFANEMGLRRHMKHAHGGIFSCDHCNLRFHNKIMLTRHAAEAHYEESTAGKKVLKCYVCDDTNFENKFELECHLVMHKYEKRQQKFAQHDMWPPHTPHHFAPYPPPHMIGPPLRPHWRQLGPPWAHFSFRHSPPEHCVRPSPHCLNPWQYPAPHAYPPPPPPPPPYYPLLTQSSDMYPLQHDDETSVASVSTSSHIARSSMITEDSTLGQQTVRPTPSTHPRHDHEYVEPTTYPWLCHPHMHGRHRHHKHFGPFGKMKWKKYLKLMMKGKVPPLVYGLGESQGIDPNLIVTQNPGASSHSTKRNNGGFTIACKFCDKIIDRKHIAWHQRKECPVLSLHRCGVCDRVFKKRHFLIKHMHEQNHYGVGSAGPSQDGRTSVLDSQTLFNLQEKMNESLTLLNCPENSTKSTEDLGDDSQCAPEPAMDTNQVATDTAFAPRNSAIEKIDPNDSRAENTGNKENKKTTSVSAGKINKFPKQNLQCITCQQVFQSVGNLSDHLKEHINQVLAVQKVREWTKKSADYFLLGYNDDDDSDEDVERSESATTTSVSFLDSDVTSATSFGIPDTNSNISSVNKTRSNDPKWIKPHKKRPSHHRKGEIKICEFCGDKFAFRKDLHFHMETKHKQSTLQCPVCNKKFSWKKRGKFYERHLNSHYGVKVFKHKCEVCDKTFLENSKLRAHMSLHKNELLHKCSVCGKGYANKSSLVRHERKHTGEKPYQCDVCQAGFVEKRELLRHSTTHTGMLPFSCMECGQGFTLKTSLMTHMKKKHSKPAEKE